LNTLIDQIARGDLRSTRGSKGRCQGKAQIIYNPVRALTQPSRHPQVLYLHFPSKKY